MSGEQNHEGEKALIKNGIPEEGGVEWREHFSVIHLSSMLGVAV
jgi:hypothetical protein